MDENKQETRRPPDRAARTDLALLLLYLLLLNLPFFAPSARFVPAHDTMAYAVNFHFIYSEYFLHGEMPRWMPYNLYGTPVDYDLCYTMSPALYFTALAGRWLGVRDSLLLFKVALLLEQLALLVGMYLLARRLFARRATRLFVCAGAAATAFWATQLYYNFRIYYLVPLALYFIVRYADTRDLKYLLTAALVAAMSLLGNVAFFAPLYVLVYGLFVVALLVRRGRRFLPAPRTVFHPLTLLLLAAVAVSVFMYLRYTAHSFDLAMSYTRGRDPITRRATLNGFLTHGGDPTDVAVLAEIVFGAPASIDGTLYIGLIPLLFLAYVFFNVRGDPFLVAAVLTGAVVLLLSFSVLTFLAPVAYWGVPLLDYFRHLRLVRPVVKILFLMVAGYGLDAWLSRNPLDPEPVSILRIGAAGMGALVLGDVVMHAMFTRALPYAQAFPNDYFGAFHLLAVAVAVAFLLLVLRASRAGRGNLGRIAVVAFLLEITSYNYLLAYVAPVRLPEVEGARYETLEDAWRQEALLRDSLTVRPCAFQPQRASPAEVRRFIDRTAPLLTRYTGAKYSTTYSAAPVDPCLQEYRVDYLPLPVDRLLRARLGIPLDKPLAGDPHLTDAVGRDPHLMEAFGCDTPKLYLAAGVHPSFNTAHAAALVRASENLHDEPVLLVEGEPPPSEPWTRPGEAGTVAVRDFTANRLRATVDASSRPGGAWLVYLDAFHPGWRVTVNGERRRVATANLAFKAVRVPGGRSEVEFTFEGNPACRLCAAGLRVMGISGTLLFLLGAAVLLAGELLGRAPAAPAPASDR